MVFKLRTRTAEQRGFRRRKWTVLGSRLVEMNNIFQVGEDVTPGRLNNNDSEEKDIKVTGE